MRSVVRRGRQAFSTAGLTPFVLLSFSLSPSPPFYNISASPPCCPLSLLPLQDTDRVST